MCGVCWSSTSVLLANNAHQSGLHFIQEESVAEGMKAACPFHLTPQRVGPLAAVGPEVTAVGLQLHFINIYLASLLC